MINKVLAIETSCDDTSVAIVDQNGWVHALCSANQDASHAPFGGIVPEIASRNHTYNLLPLIEQCFQQSKLSWSEIDGICVTSRPGLVGSLIVGLVTAKSLAMVHQIPFLGVNHLEGHLLAPFLSDKDYQPSMVRDEPLIALAISGGHTSLYLVHEIGKYEILGRTRDDAAGEAFDKFAKMIGLGFPGGQKVDQWAQVGNFQAFQFPRGLAGEDHFDMSFSGLKSAAQRMVATLSPEQLETQMADLCASYQEAIVDSLMEKLDLAVQKKKIKRVVLTGGVSANTRLRNRATEWAEKKKISLAIPPIRYCTDNAAMIGYAGILRMNRGETSPLNLGPSPSYLPNDFLNHV